MPQSPLFRTIASKFGRQNSPRRAPTRGAPTNCLHLWAKRPAFSRYRFSESATEHYGLHSSRPFVLRRAPTRGEGTHKGCPYQLSSSLGQETGVQGYRPFESATVLYGLRSSRPFVLRSAPTREGRAPTRGAPTNSGSFRRCCPIRCNWSAPRFGKTSRELQARRSTAMWDYSSCPARMKYCSMPVFEGERGWSSNMPSSGTLRK